MFRKKICANMMQIIQVRNGNINYYVSLYCLTILRNFQLCASFDMICGTIQDDLLNAYKEQPRVFGESYHFTEHINFDRNT